MDGGKECAYDEYNRQHISSRMIKCFEKLSNYIINGKLLPNESCPEYVT